MRKVLWCLLFVFICCAEVMAAEVDNILVKKSMRKMYLREGDNVLKEYNISLGGNPKGHKTEQGDERTPEGEYVISGRNPKSAYHLSLRISYPNEADKKSAAERGVSPGGDIMIHGYPNRVINRLFDKIHQNYDWTDGCIAVTDDEIEEIWKLVSNQTKIVIKP